MTPHTPWPLSDVTVLCAAIDAGQLDDDLAPVIDAINRRMAVIAHARTGDALSRLTIGQRVRLDQHVKPNYLRGEVGTVHEFDGDVVVILLDRVVGRFTSRHIRCSPEVLQVIADT